jgi:hypothetical protein
MPITLGDPSPQLTIEELLNLAAEWANRGGDSFSTDICHLRVRACLDIAKIKLAKTDQEISERQIELAQEANSLSDKLLKSNEQASKDSEKNAQLMNSATEQLASSTKSLNWATWALVIFTAVQAFIAIAAFFKK